MRLRLLLLLMLSSLPLSAAANITQRLEQHCNDSDFSAASWGIYAVSLETGQPLVAYNANQYFVPCSLLKLFTGAVALDRLGPGFTIRTSAYAEKRPDDYGTLKGNLYLYGRGDPTLLIHKQEGSKQGSLEELADNLAATGVKRIEGDLIADERFFYAPPHGLGWEWDDMQYYYAPALSALSVNQNVVSFEIQPGETIGSTPTFTITPDVPYLSFENLLTTGKAGSPSSIDDSFRAQGLHHLTLMGSIAIDKERFKDRLPVPDPAAFTATLFKALLKEKGITLTGKVRTLSWMEQNTYPKSYERFNELAWVESPPLKDMIDMAFTQSVINLYPELISLQIGEHYRQYTEDPSLRKARTNVLARKALDEFLEAINIDPQDVVSQEGTGLARKTLIKPKTIGNLLSIMQGHPSFDYFYEALSFAGVDAFFKDRMVGTLAENNARVKSGIMSFNYNMAGYLTTAAGEPIAFTVMLNNYNKKNKHWHPKDAIDTVAVMLAEIETRDTTN